MMAMTVKETLAGLQKTLGSKKRKRTLHQTTEEAAGLKILLSKVKKEPVARIAEMKKYVIQNLKDPSALN